MDGMNAYVTCMFECMYDVCIRMHLFTYECLHLYVYALHTHVCMSVYHKHLMQNRKIVSYECLTHTQKILHPDLKNQAMYKGKI